MLGSQRARRDRKRAAARRARSRRSIAARASISRWRGRVPIPRIFIDRLDRLTADAHQVIYQQREFGAHALGRIVAQDFPRAVRADAGLRLARRRVAAVPHARGRRARVLPARSDSLGRRR